MKTRPKAAVGYIRVSTEGQAQNGVSLDAQRDRIQTWASHNGYSLAAVHVDSGISGGKLTNRPAAQKALAEACRRKAALVVYSLSRLARSTKDAIETSERLHKAGADLVSLSEAIDTTTAAGKMVFRMLAVLAEFERDLVSERTTTAMQHLKSQNRRVGRWLPYGFDLGADGQHLTENPVEQQTIAAHTPVARRRSESADHCRRVERQRDTRQTGWRVESRRHPPGTARGGVGRPRQTERCLFALADFRIQSRHRLRRSVRKRAQDQNKTRPRTLRLAVGPGEKVICDAGTMMEIIKRPGRIRHRPVGLAEIATLCWRYDHEQTKESTLGPRGDVTARDRPDEALAL